MEHSGNLLAAQEGAGRAPSGWPSPSCMLCSCSRGLHQLPTSKTLDQGVGSQVGAWGSSLAGGVARSPRQRGTHWRQHSFDRRYSGACGPPYQELHACMAACGFNSCSDASGRAGL